MPSIGIPSSASKTLINEATPMWQRVRANAAQLVRLKNLSTSEQVLFWSGFTYVPSAIITPIMTDWQLRQSKMPKYEKNLVVKTEIARQAIGAVIHFLFFFGGVLLAGLSDSTKPRTFQKLAAAIVSATIGNAFVRPWLVNAYTARWVAKNRPEFLVSRAFFSTPQTQSHSPLSPSGLPHGYHTLSPLLFQASAWRLLASSSPNKQANTNPPNTLAIA